MPCIAVERFVAGSLTLFIKCWRSHQSLEIDVKGFVPASTSSYRMFSVQHIMLAVWKFVLVHHIHYNMRSMQQRDVWRDAPSCVELLLIVTQTRIMESGTVISIAALSFTMAHDLCIGIHDCYFQ